MGLRPGIKHPTRLAQYPAAVTNGDGHLRRSRASAGGAGDKVTQDELHSWRELRLSTFLESSLEPADRSGRRRTILLLLSMTVQGWDGAFLPYCWLTSLPGQARWWPLNIPRLAARRFPLIYCE